MDTADFNYKDFETRDAGDTSVYAQFYIKPVKDEAETALQGRVIFKNKEYVRIIAPGNQNNIVDRPVSDLDRARFPRQYAKFQDDKNADQLEGTLLSEVGWVDPAQLEELAYMKIRTVEHLAGVTDDVCGKYAGLYDLKRRAQQVLKAAQDRAPVTALQDELRKKDEQIAELTTAIQGLTKEIQALKAKK